MMVLVLGTIGCKRGEEGQAMTVKIDGSSTVYPITKAVGVQFKKGHAEASVEIGVSGTGGGFKKFLNGETDITNASRAIKESEIAVAKEKGIDWIELKVAVDGLSVVVNPENDWCDALTVAQLKQLWEPDSKIAKWSDLDSRWPEEVINLYGPDTDSGTFEYFTEEIVGEKGASRTDYDPNADDNVLVTGVKGDKFALGYFGYAYYIENKDDLKVLKVAPGDDIGAAVEPNDETIKSGAYTPLSRPLFLYVNTASLKKPAVVDFLKFYLEGGQQFVKEAEYIPLSDDLYKQSTETLNEAIKKAGS